MILTFITKKYLLYILNIQQQRLIGRLGLTNDNTMGQCDDTTDQSKRNLGKVTGKVWQSYSGTTMGQVQARIEIELPLSRWNPSRVHAWQSQIEYAPNRTTANDNYVYLYVPVSVRSNALELRSDEAMSIGYICTYRDVWTINGRGVLHWQTFGRRLADAYG